MIFLRRPRVLQVFVALMPSSSSNLLVVPFTLGNYCSLHSTLGNTKGCATARSAVEAGGEK